MLLAVPVTKPEDIALQVPDPRTDALYYMLVSVGRSANVRYEDYVSL
jgi:hypothetical protein